MAAAKGPGSSSAVKWILLFAVGVGGFLYLRSRSQAQQAAAAQTTQALQQQTGSPTSYAGVYQGGYTPYTIDTYDGGGGNPFQSYYSGAGTIGSAGTGQVTANGTTVTGADGSVTNNNTVTNSAT